MKKFTLVTGIAVPWLMPNIDTDIITPMKRMLSSPGKLDRYAFEPFRFIGGNADTGGLNPEFPLNMPQYRGAEIMVVGENFGGGSSRETAPAAIAGLGFRCLIGSSFGGIFFKNCYKLGLLPVSLSPELVRKLASEAEEGIRFVIDLAKQEISTGRGTRCSFEVEALRKTSLLEGLDDVGMTLKQKSRILDFFSRDQTRRPWVYSKALV
jgi:3-isopropylmalate/(R)-2-methylmalate dehydratase small subunit